MRHEACVLSILLYGCESWPPYCHKERRWNAFRMRPLRKIIGVTWEDKVPDVRILEICQSSNLTTLIRKRRLRWIGHEWKIAEYQSVSSLANSLPADAQLVVPVFVTRTLLNGTSLTSRFQLILGSVWLRTGTCRSMIGVEVGCSSRNFELLRWRQHITRQRRRDSENQIINSDGSQE